MLKLNFIFWLVAGLSLLSGGISRAQDTIASVPALDV